MSKTSAEITELLASDSKIKRKEGFDKMIKAHYEFMFNRARYYLKDDDESSDVVNKFIFDKIDKEYILSNEKIKNLQAFLNKAISNVSLTRLKKLATEKKKNFIR